MTETGLIVAEVAFLVLLYLFIWGIIRASSRQLQADLPSVRPSPDAAPLIVPLGAGPEPGHVAAPSGVLLQDDSRRSASAPGPTYHEVPEGAEEEHGPEPFPEAFAQSPSPTALGGASIAAGGTPSLAPDISGEGESESSDGDPPEDPSPPIDAESEPAQEEIHAYEEIPDDAEPLEEGEISGGDALAARRAGRDPLLDLVSDIHPRLVVEKSPGRAAGEEFDLTGGITIGRSDTSDLAISDEFVSHMHARILRRGPYYFLEDLGSTNGTFINDRRVERDAQLRVRDVLRLGDTVLRYEE